MDIIKFENFGEEPINEGESYDKIMKLPNIGDLKQEQLLKLQGAKVVPIPHPTYNINKRAQAIGKAAFGGLEKKKPTLYLVDKTGKGLCIIA